MKYTYVLSLIILISCSKDKEKIDELCIDESLIDKFSACIEIYQPVCGCDGITYPNSCYATTFNGIVSYTEGECN
ncbi:MAG: Kazal-type serine protease inhibitor [Pelagibacteraceae bacterium]|jgi:hypothetical protein